MIPYVGRLLLVLSIVVPRRCGPAYDCSTAVFIALGLCAIVPVTQLFLTHGYHELFTEMGANWLLASGALYIGGAML